MDTMKWISLFTAVILCGCVGQESFMVTDIVFCENEPFDRSYNQKIDAVYAHKDIVWIYIEAFRFSYTEEDLTYVAYFDTKLEVYDDQGTLIGEVTQPMEVPSQEELVYVWFKFWIDTIELKEGVYTAKITVTDTVSGETAVTEGTFTVEK